MRDEFFVNQHDEEENRAIYYWWKSAAKFNECVKFKFEMPNLTKMTPTLKVLREMERLALMSSESLDELRQKLMSYRAGDFWVPIGGINKEDMDIPPMNTIVLVGFHNAGKSSLVNLMYSVLGRSGLIPFAQTSSGNASAYTSLIMEEHNVLRSARSGFCIYDTRGFDYDKVDEGLQELKEWMADGVHHKKLCSRPGDILPKLDNELEDASSMFVNRKVNCVMLVANASEIYKSLRVGDLKPLDALKQLFCSTALKKSNGNPILILTHGDKLSTEDRIDCRLKICKHLGTSETTGTYDIVCVTEYGLLADEYDPISAYAVTEAVYRALLISDRAQLVKQTFLDWALFALSWLMCFLAGIFAFLAHVFNVLAQKHNGKLKW
ncbi:PREDICTED: uncharacterized protein LOC109225524 isoform X1 [Nicotiana attenuata]|uniref:Uncharacterized protein n=1 Tax=Nicotiana attenuata TaxID=49451 RepID=A0A1J6JE21_NICAT|nr:PREDICTED: uncharacterized protein LOC109225524 isoform X1 [Nicotiana attenuata]OIT07927.1 hypothetical protein A4A49_01112 [Nicotiana attenuata]